MRDTVQRNYSAPPAILAEYIYIYRRHLPLKKISPADAPARRRPLYYPLLYLRHLAHKSRPAAKWIPRAGVSGTGLRAGEGRIPRK